MLLRSFQQWLRRKPRHRLASLLTLLFGVLLPFQIFGSLAEDVWEREGGFAWDVPILLAIHQTARPQLDTMAITLTKLGVFWGVFPFALAVACFLFLKRYWHRFTYFLIVLSGSIIINRTVKLLLHRVRPHLWQSPSPETDYGFPSGHAMSSMTLVVALLILTWDTRWRLLVLLLGACFVLVIGWTRLYLGVHYPSDILAGWTVSVAWAVGVSLLMKPLSSKPQQ